MYDCPLFAFTGIRNITSIPAAFLLNSKTFFPPIVPIKSLIEKYLKNVDCEKAYQFRRAYQFQVFTIDFIIDTLKTYPKHLIIRSFDWATTDDGYDFWEFVSTMWCHHFDFIRYGKIKKI